MLSCGISDVEALSRLAAYRELQQRSNGTSVRTMQAKLTDAGYNPQPASLKEGAQEAGGMLLGAINDVRKSFRGLGKLIFGEKSQG